MSRVRRADRFTITPEPLIFDTRVGNAIRLWLVLDRIAAGRDGCIPPRSELARVLGVDVKTLDKWKAVLVETGWLKVESGADSGTANTYWLTTPEMPIPAEGGADSGCPVSSPPPTPEIGSGGAPFSPHPTSLIENQEKLDNPPPPDGGAPPAQSNVVSITRKPAKRRTRIPDDFAVTDAMRAWAAEHVPDLDVDRATDIFKDFWIGDGRVKADWIATWRNWLRKEQDQLPASGGARRPVAAGNSHVPFRNNPPGTNYTDW